MPISSSVIYYLLSRRCEISSIAESGQGSMVKGVRLLSSEASISSEYLYVVEECELEAISGAKNCAFAVINSSFAKPASGIPFADITFISTTVCKIVVTNIISDIFVDLYEWESSLKDALIAKNDLGTIIGIGKELLKTDVWLINTNFEYLSSTIGSDPGYDAQNQRVRVPLTSFSELLFDEDFLHHNSKIGPFKYSSRSHSFLCCNIFIQNQFQARILAYSESPEAIEGEMQIFKMLCGYISLCYVGYADSDESANKASQNAQMHEVIYSLVEKERLISPNRLKSAFETAKWAHEHKLAIVVIRDSNKHTSSLSAPYLIRKLEDDWQFSYAVKLDSDIVWLINRTLSKVQEHVQQLSQYLAYTVRDMVCNAGVSADATGFESISLLYEQAKQALVYGQQKSPHLWYYLFEDYALDYMVGHMKGAFPGETLWHRGIKKLMEHDALNSTDYTKTLNLYIQCNLNATVAAQKAIVHRTTFFRRLERIREIGGIDLDNPNEILHIAMSYKLIDGF